MAPSTSKSALPDSEKEKVALDSLHSEKRTPVKFVKPGLEKYAARYKELTAECNKLRKQLAPHREVHDRLVNDPKLIEARQKIKAISAVLGPLEQERASLAKLLGGLSLSIGIGDALAPALDANDRDGTVDGTPRYGG